MLRMAGRNSDATWSPLGLHFFEIPTAQLAVIDDRVNNRNPRRFLRHRISRALGAVALGAITAGCPVMQPARVAQFAQAVDTVHAQTQIAFKGINDLVTEDEIEKATKLNHLSESDVVEVLTAESILKWNTAFSFIDSYCANLQTLLAPDRAAEFRTSVVDFGKKLTKLKPDVMPSPMISSAFAELGSLLTAAKAESNARRVAQKVDPAIQDLFSKMADAIENADEPSLVTTVRVHWSDRLDAKDREFRTVNAQLKPTSSSDDVARIMARKRQIVLEYIQLRDQRDAQLLSLTSLRRSLLGLADAHSGLARGSQTDVSAALSLIQAELEQTKAIYEEFRSMKGDTEANHG